MVIPGARMAVEYRCERCGNRALEDKIKKCGSCGAWFGATDDQGLRDIAPLPTLTAAALGRVPSHA